MKTLLFILPLFALNVLLFISASYADSSTFKIECKGTNCEKIREYNVSERKLRFEEYKIGMCYINITKHETTYLKLVSVDKERMIFATENNLTKRKLVRIRENFENRKWNKMFPEGLRTFNCSDTPNLGDKEYMDDCWNIRRYKMRCVNKSLKKFSDRRNRRVYQ